MKKKIYTMEEIVSKKRNTALREVPRSGKFIIITSRFKTIQLQFRAKK